MSYAGAWTKPKGSGYANLSFTHLTYTSVFERNGALNLTGTVEDYTVNAYLEYGLSQAVTFVGQVPYKMTSFRGHSLNGIGNMELGLKHALKDSNHIISLQWKYRSNNFGGFDLENGLRTGFDNAGLNLAILHGKGWSKAYTTSEVGFLFMLGDYSDYIRFSTEWGTKINWKGKSYTWIIAVLEGFISLGNRSHDDGLGTQTYLYRNNMGWISPGLKVGHYFNEKWAVNFAGYGAIYALYGGRAPTLTIGLSYEW